MSQSHQSISLAIETMSVFRSAARNPSTRRYYNKHLRTLRAIRDQELDRLVKPSDGKLTTAIDEAIFE